MCIFERMQPIQVRTEQPIAAKRKRGLGRLFKQSDPRVNWVLVHAASTGEVELTENQMSVIRLIGT